MTGTTMTTRVLGSAWPQHMSKPIAEITHQNMEKVGMPAWSEADQALAKAVQRELKVPEQGLATSVQPLVESMPEERKTGSGSDDIGDISWTVPTITLRYPANIPNLPGHNWTSAIAMATPIAHKGTTTGAKVEAMTLLDLLLRPDVVMAAKAYFTEVQTKDTKYQAFISADDKPAIWLNRDTMDRFRPQMRKLYYDPTRYKTYLEQLGIEYPTVR
jgi:aminobenzoyl-glutamate utilization protein B